jgi:hypothetical protein
VQNPNISGPFHPIRVIIAGNVHARGTVPALQFEIVQISVGQSYLRGESVVKDFFVEISAATSRSLPEPLLSTHGLGVP